MIDEGWHRNFELLEVAPTMVGVWVDYVEMYCTWSGVAGSHLLGRTKARSLNVPIARVLSLALVISMRFR